MSEATALPTAPQPLPYDPCSVYKIGHCFFFSFSFVFKRNSIAKFCWSMRHRHRITSHLNWPPSCKNRHSQKWFINTQQNRTKQIAFRNCKTWLRIFLSFLLWRSANHNGLVYWLQRAGSVQSRTPEWDLNLFLIRSSHGTVVASSHQNVWSPVWIPVSLERKTTVNEKICTNRKFLRMFHSIFYIFRSSETQTRTRAP